MGPGLAHLGAALGRKWLRFRARLRRGFSIGIAGRLATSFAAVTALAIAANVMIEREIAVVQTTRVDRGQYSPAPDVRAPAAPGRARRRASASRETLHSDIVPAEIDRFQAALEHYQRAIEARVAMDTNAAEEVRRAAQRDLDIAVRAVGTEQAREARGVQAAARELRARRSQITCKSADQRRSVLQQYQDRLDAMDKRITASMSRALKLFGRVFARQSLLRLHASVDELQRRFTDVAAASVADPDALDALIDSEDALAEAFRADEASFSRSDGPDWVRAMHRELSRARDAARRGDRDRQYPARGDCEVRGSARPAPRLGARDLVRVPHRVRAPDQSRACARVPPALPPAIASPIVDAVTTTTTTTTTVPDHHRRVMVAWITAAVLLVWLAISVWTMRSILDSGGPPDRGDAQARARRGCARAARRPERAERPVRRLQPHGIQLARRAKSRRITGARSRRRSSSARACCSIWRSTTRSRCLRTAASSSSCSTARSSGRATQRRRRRVLHRSRQLQESQRQHGPRLRRPRAHQRRAAPGGDRAELRFRRTPGGRRIHDRARAGRFPASGARGRTSHRRRFRAAAQRRGTQHHGEREHRQRASTRITSTPPKTC